MPSEIDDLAIKLAGSQAGVFGRAQLGLDGRGRGLVERRLTSGRWTALSRNVLAISGTPDSVDRRRWAAVLHTPSSVITHRDAGRKHQFSLVGDGWPEITTEYGGASRSPFAIVHRSIDLGPSDIVHLDGLPFSSVARTVTDLLTVMPRRRVERIVDDLLNARRVTHEELAAAHARYEGCGRPATVSMREILAERGPGYVAPGSVLESMALELFATAGFPEPARQVPLPGWTVRPGLVDLAFIDQKVIVELDGRRWHGRDQAFQADRERDHTAMLAGWFPLRFTWTHLSEQPQYVISTVRRALRLL